MSVDTELTASATEQYTVAYEAHYTLKDLRFALELYIGIIALHPDAREAGYSRAQIHNIVNAVVPQQELMDAQVDMAMAQLSHVDGDDLDSRSVIRPSVEHN